MRPRISVVVPCFNERERLNTSTFSDFARGQDRVRFVMVDDGSTDETHELLESLRAQNPNAFEVVRLASNSGKAEAVRRGALSILDRSPVGGIGHYLAYWDADLATPLDALADLAEVLDNRDQVEIVLASRVRLLGRRIQRDPRRHYAGRLAATFVSQMLRLPVYDTQCGAKLFRITARLRPLFASPFSSRWIFDVEILARWILNAEEAQRNRIEEYLVEYPLERWTDVRGTKITKRDAAQVPLDLLRLWATYGRRLRELGRP